MDQFEKNKTNILLFSEELEYLNQINARVCEHVINLLKYNSDEKFWTESASKTGVHHPATSNCYRGNVMHTRQAFWIANGIIESWQDIESKDEIKIIVLSAILLHDLDKFSESLEKHGHTAASKIYYYLGNNLDKLIGIDFYMMIIGLCVEYHMGKWGKHEYKLLKNKTTNLAVQITHTADYLASRAFLEFNHHQLDA